MAFTAGDGWSELTGFRPMPNSAVLVEDQEFPWETGKTKDELREEADHTFRMRLRKARQPARMQRKENIHHVIFKRREHAYATDRSTTPISWNPRWDLDKIKREQLKSFDHINLETWNVSWLMRLSQMNELRCRQPHDNELEVEEKEDRIATLNRRQLQSRQITELVNPRPITFEIELKFLTDIKTFKRLVKEKLVELGFSYYTDKEYKMYWSDVINAGISRKVAEWRYSGPITEANGHAHVQNQWKTILLEEIAPGDDAGADSDEGFSENPRKSWPSPDTWPSTQPGNDESNDDGDGGPPEGGQRNPAQRVPDQTAFQQQVRGPNISDPRQPQRDNVELGRRKEGAERNIGTSVADPVTAERAAATATNEEFLELYKKANPQADQFEINIRFNDFFDAAHQNRLAQIKLLQEAVKNPSAHQKADNVAALTLTILRNDIQEYWRDNNDDDSFTDAPALDDHSLELRLAHELAKVARRYWLLASCNFRDAKKRLDMDAKDISNLKPSTYGFSVSEDVFRKAFNLLSPKWVSHWLYQQVQAHYRENRAEIGLIVDKSFPPSPDIRDEQPWEVQVAMGLQSFAESLWKEDTTPELMVQALSAFAESENFLGEYVGIASRTEVKQMAKNLIEWAVEKIRAVKELNSAVDSLLAQEANDGGNIPNLDGADERLDREYRSTTRKSSPKRSRAVGEESEEGRVKRPRTKKVTRFTLPLKVFRDSD